MKRESLLALLLAATSFAAGAAGPTDDGPAAKTHRYLVERTFAPGALDKANAEKIIANNRKAGVHWEKSFVNAEKTKTYCIYEGPDEKSVRAAAALNGLPVDSITEIPVTLAP
jgi:hypothetical protein